MRPIIIIIMIFQVKINTFLMSIMQMRAHNHYSYAKITDYTNYIDFFKRKLCLNIYLWSRQMTKDFFACNLGEGNLKLMFGLEIRCITGTCKQFLGSKKVFLGQFWPSFKYMIDQYFTFSIPLPWPLPLKINDYFERLNKQKELKFNTSIFYLFNFYVWYLVIFDRLLLL